MLAAMIIVVIPLSSRGNSQSFLKNQFIFSENAFEYCFGCELLQQGFAQTFFSDLPFFLLYKISLDSSEFLCMYPLHISLGDSPFIPSLHFLPAFAYFSCILSYRLTAYSSLCPFPPAQHSPNLSHQAQFSPSVRFWMIIFFLLHSISTSPVRAICFS